MLGRSGLAIATSLCRQPSDVDCSPGWAHREERLARMCHILASRLRRHERRLDMVLGFEWLWSARERVGDIDTSFLRPDAGVHNRRRLRRAERSARPARQRRKPRRGGRTWLSWHGRHGRRGGRTWKSRHGRRGWSQRCFFVESESERQQHGVRIRERVGPARPAWSSWPGIGRVHRRRGQSRERRGSKGRVAPYAGAVNHPLPALLLIATRVINTKLAS